MYTISESSIQEDERQKSLGKVMNKIKELDDEVKGVPSSGSSNQGSTTISNRTVTSSMSGT